MNGPISFTKNWPFTSQLSWHEKQYGVVNIRVFWNKQKRTVFSWALAEHGVSSIERQNHISAGQNGFSRIKRVYVWKSRDEERKTSKDAKKCLALGEIVDTQKSSDRGRRQKEVAAKRGTSYAILNRSEASASVVWKLDRCRTFYFLLLGRCVLFLNDNNYSLVRDWSD